MSGNLVSVWVCDRLALDKKDKKSGEYKIYMEINCVQYPIFGSNLIQMAEIPNQMTATQIEKPESGNGGLL